MAENDFYRVMKVIKEFLIKERVGSVTCNMYLGGISSINVNETLNWRADEKRKKGLTKGKDGGMVGLKD